MCLVPGTFMLNALKEAPGQTYFSLVDGLAPPFPDIADAGLHDGIIEWTASLAEMFQGALEGLAKLGWPHQKILQLALK